MPFTAQMTDSLPPEHRVVLYEHLDAIPAAAWDALTDGEAGLTHAFLAQLEACGCVGPDTGWFPCHATLWHGEQLVAALPLYRKHHSYGEYVFDWAWARAYQQHGLAYYPKWLAALPFTPIPGPRLLGKTPSQRIALLAEVLRRARDEDISSLHILFTDPHEIEWMRAHGMLVRQGVQFHWHNAIPPYRDFDAFLATLNHDKRKKIRQERRRAAEHGLRYRWLNGTQARDHDWGFFHRCYAATYARHGAMPYLTQAFFQGLARHMPDRVRLLLAEREGAPLAAAFFLCDHQALYGRYWGYEGTATALPFLHFELCYYQAIEYCIEHGLARFEGGAQGEHKLARGLSPTVTYSAHWLRDARFHDAVDRYLAQETTGIGFYLDELAERSPFRQT